MNSDSQYIIIDQEIADLEKKTCSYRVRGFKTLKQAVSTIMKENALTEVKVARIVPDFDVIEIK